MKPFKIYKPVERRYYPGAILCTKFARNAGLGSTEFLQQSMILHIIQQAHICLLLYDLDKAVSFAKTLSNNPGLLHSVEWSTQLTLLLP